MAEERGSGTVFTSEMGISYSRARCAIAMAAERPLTSLYAAARPIGVKSITFFRD